MNVRNWLAREQTFLNYLRDGDIDWSAVPQHEINSLIFWTTKGKGSDERNRDIQVLRTTPLNYIRYICDKEISIAEDSLREYARQYELSAIADSKIHEEEHHETI